MIRLVPRLVTKTGINNVFRLKQHSLEKSNGRIPADFVLLKRFLSSNSLSPSVELTDHSFAAGEDLSKLDDNVYSSDDNTNQQQQSDVPFVTYSQNNPPQVVYDFFKRLVYSQRSVKSRSVLTGVLKGVLAGNFCSEFSSYYFEAWWKDYVNFLENPSTNHPFLITNLNNLGKINKLTNGEMGKMYFNAKVFQFLDAKFRQIEFDKLSAEAVFSYFRGMSNLVDEQRIFNVKLISKETIAQTMNFFKANFASNTSPTFVNAYASFLNCLAKFGCVLNKSDFQVLVEYFKTTVFDDASFASSSSSVDEKLPNLKKSVTYDEFAIKCRAIYNFGEAFLQFGLNPDVFATDVLSSWFACWKRLLSIDMKMIEYVRGLSDSERRLSQRLSATEIIKLCDVAAQLSTRFGKQAHFLDSLELWNDVMEKNIFPASMHTVVPFSNTMHVTALNFTAVAKLDSNFYVSGAPSALLSDTAVQSMLSKVQNEHDFKRKSILMQQEQAIRLRRNDQRKIRFSYRDAASDENKNIRITQQP